MRIAILTSSYPRFPGDGIASFIKSISEQLALLGHQVEVVAPYDPAVRPDPSETVKLHRFRYIWPDRLHVMGHGRSLEKDVRLKPLVFILLPFFMLSALVKLLSVCRKQRTEVIYAHWVLPNGPVAAWAAALCKIPFILSLHGSDIFVARRNKVFGWVARWVFQRAAVVTTCSPVLKAAALKLGAPEDTLLLPWGTDPDVFTPQNRSRPAPVEGDSPVIIASLGRFVHKKGFEYLLDAFPEVIHEFPQARLILAGEGDLMSAFQRQVKALGIEANVSLPGGIPYQAVPGFLADADLFVLPSVIDKDGNEDGLPSVLVEAMSSGIAVISTRIGGTALVVENGENGLLIDPGDVSQLSEAILELLRNPEMRQKLGDSARRSITDQHNLANAAASISALLETATSERANLYQAPLGPR